MNEIDTRLLQLIEREEERRVQADAMIQTVRAERKTGFFEFLRDMLFGLGLKNVFYGIGDVLFITLSVAAAFFIVLANAAPSLAQIDNRIFGITFAASPVLYFIFFVISVIKEKSEGSYEVKMVCRYTAIHLVAFRMFAAGIGCLLLNTAAAAVVTNFAEVQFADILAVSFSSLFLFALVMIMSLLRFGVKGVAFPAVLLAVCSCLCTLPEYCTLMKNIPIAAYIIIGIIALLAYQRILDKINGDFSYVMR